MGGKETFRILPPELRAMALAGHYLQSFAIMETAINHAIGKGLNLTSLQETIVCKNVSFRDKTYILRTLISMAPIGPKSSKNYQSLMDAVTSFSTDRNMVAHDLFGPDESGEGIEFFVSKAKKELKFPKTVWSVDQTEEKSEELLAATAKIRKLADIFEKSDLIRSLVMGKTQYEPETISKLLQLGFLSPEDLQAPVAHERSRQKTSPTKARGTRQKTPD